jgi:hypothetical protein
MDLQRKLRHGRLDRDWRQRRQRSLLQCRSGRRRRWRLLWRRRRRVRLLQPFTLRRRKRRRRNELRRRLHIRREQRPGLCEYYLHYHQPGRHREQHRTLLRRCNDTAERYSDNGRDLLLDRAERLYLEYSESDDPIFHDRQCGNVFGYGFHRTIVHGNRFDHRSCKSGACSYGKLGSRLQPGNDKPDGYRCQYLYVVAGHRTFRNERSHGQCITGSHNCLHGDRHERIRLHGNGDIHGYRRSEPGCFGGSNYDLQRAVGNPDGKRRGKLYLVSSDGSFDQYRYIGNCESYDYDNVYCNRNFCGWLPVERNCNRYGK